MMNCTCGGYRPNMNSIFNPFYPLADCSGVSNNSNNNNCSCNNNGVSNNNSNCNNGVSNNNCGCNNGVSNNNCGCNNNCVCGNSCHSNCCSHRPRPNPDFRPGPMGPMGPIGPIGPTGPVGPTGPSGVVDYAYFTAAGTTITESGTIPLLLADSQIASDITTDGQNIILPAGKYAVSYSLQGTGDAAGTVTVIPNYAGSVGTSVSRSDIITADNLQANVNGVFTFTSAVPTTLRFDVNLASGTTSLTGVLFSAVVEEIG